MALSTPLDFATIEGATQPMDFVMPTMKLQISDNAERLHISVETSRGEEAGMDAAKVEELISALARSRAAMKPARANADPFLGTRYMEPLATRYYVQADPNVPEHVVLALMSPGFGWLAIPLDRPEAENLASLLLQCLPPRKS